MKLTKDHYIEGKIVKEGTEIKIIEASSEMVDISQIKVGDTVEHDGKEMTVGKGDIKGNSDSFMGITLFGDSYSLGHKKVKRILK